MVKNIYTDYLFTCLAIVFYCTKMDLVATLAADCYYRTGIVLCDGTVDGVDHAFYIHSLSTIKIELILAVVSFNNRYVSWRRIILFLSIN
jgi:hypothetical protein